MENLSRIKNKNKKKEYLVDHQGNSKFIFNLRKPVDKMLKDADNWCSCIFVFTRKAKKYLMVEKSKPIKSGINRILNMGNIYCYSSQ
jgi:hypothetical protein